MKPHSYTFSFKNLLFGIFFGIILIFLASIIVNYIIENSNHRLSKVFSSQKNKFFNFFYWKLKSGSF